ncbi:leucine-rich repeats (6 copies)-containing protein [Trichomonas vaginalis G3]|uniref:leucine-rich repeats (6 copies)-containing protein n=1 Tax=Trichomonas vaginalis (strain ATCC PRA-98 / G3) TaxID=412133 RepID=UPI0021E5A013|nr:leucine-rich repeats (6 copies)-containing protein [Trichomonas vaginalis G3]KAI5493820.1 leucine-rich repeats (6 copies)-containing protein [Trichomonas vaginalis G3]
MTYGKLLSTYIVPSRVKSIGNNAINSLPRYNEETRKVVDFGLTTLVIRTKVKSDQSPVYNAPYLHNLCYGGSVKTEGFNDVPRVFVADYYARSLWNQNPKVVAIKAECDSAVPFENYAKYDYTYPKNPRYISLPEQILPQDSKKCPLFDDPYEIPYVKPENSPKEGDTDVENSTETVSELSLSENTYTSAFMSEEKATTEKSSMPLLTYILIALAAIEVLMIAGLIAFLIHKRNEESSDESFVEMSEHIISNISASTTFTNPLFSMNTMDDDPFASDFDDPSETEAEVGDFIDDSLCDA